MKSIYSVWDKVAETFFSLFVSTHDAPAIRSFSDALVDPKSPWAAHPGDYELHCLGEMGEGLEDTLQGYDRTRVVVTGSAVMAQNASGPQLAQEA